MATRNGLGAFGGRVTKIALKGTTSTVTLTGNEFRAAFGLKSDLFQVADFSRLAGGRSRERQGRRLLARDR